MGGENREHGLGGFCMPGGRWKILPKVWKPGVLFRQLAQRGSPRSLDPLSPKGDSCHYWQKWQLKARFGDFVTICASFQKLAQTVPGQVSRHPRLTYLPSRVTGRVPIRDALSSHNICLIQCIIPLWLYHNTNIILAYYNAFMMLS